jgi:acetyltransferase-like isoleucine patch superfamily enzyme
MLYENKNTGVSIRAARICIDPNVTLGRNVTVRAHGEFRVGKYSKIGDDTLIEGNNIHIGKHFYGSGGMVVGAGGQQYPNANLKIGDRCVIHDNTINVCEPVEIGDDVGFSGRVEIITHGFWLSALQGHPVNFSGVKINNGVILGFGSTILMGVSIAEQVVVGASSLVSKDLVRRNSIYAGSPAKFIRTIKPLSETEQVALVDSILEKYSEIAKYQGINPFIKSDFPNIEVNKFRFNVITHKYEGIEDDETDNLRDYFRKWGIRIYTERPFSTHFEL